jgi:hypothetical protein
MPRWHLDRAASVLTQGHRHPLPGTPSPCARATAFAVPATLGALHDRQVLQRPLLRCQAQGTQETMRQRDWAIPMRINL